MKKIRGNRRGGHYNLFYSIFVYNIYLYLDTVFIIIANPLTITISIRNFLFIIPSFCPA